MDLPDINQVGDVAWREAVRAAGGKASDGPIRSFAGGWAMLFPLCDRGHYWQPNRHTPQGICPHGRAGIWRSLCHVDGRTTDKLPAVGLGNYPRCKHCQRQANKLRLK